MADKKGTKIKFKKHLLTREQLQALDKKDLTDKVLQLEAHVYQLRNIIKKSNLDPTDKIKKPTEQFNFSQCHKRHILLKFYYLGWNYHGYVEQEDTSNTVEHQIFNALRRSCLIEDRDASNYNCCGRTDKGVSAFSQVISLDVRSKLTDETMHDIANEIDYCKILNRILPSDIKCLAWAPVSHNFSARFDCSQRTYHYFFPRGQLDIQAMNLAAQILKGRHDFRNLCKMDVGNGVVTFERTITDAKIIVLTRDPQGESAYDICTFVIKSQAFLWHQIRCIMSVLLLIGQKKEKPEVLHDLFNVEKCPAKPQYPLAHELPLNLYNCEYDEVQWLYDQDEVAIVMNILQKDWTLSAVKAEMTRNMIESLSKHASPNSLECSSVCLIEGVQPREYQPLMQRPKCESLENRIRHFEKRKKIENDLEGYENTA